MQPARLEMDASASSLLHGLRGLVAVAVVAGHLAALMFVPGQRADAFWVPFQLLTGIAHESVVIFFVLSGFFVGGNAIARMRCGQWQWRDYVIDRSTRLYLVLLPALLLGAALDSAGLVLFPQSAVYHRAFFDVSVFRTPVDDTFAATNLAATAVFLSRIFVTEPFGSNVPLWSLAYEFWFYMVAPVLFSAVLFPSVRTFALAALGLAVFLLTARGPFVLAYFTFWLAGAVAGAVPRPRSGLGRILSMLVVLVALGAPFLRQATGKPYAVTDWAVAASWTAAVYVIAANGCGARLAEYWQRVLTLWGSFSYSLYAVHYPVLVFFYALARELGYVKAPYAAGLVGPFVFVLLAVVLLAFAFSRLTEANTDAVRRRLKRVLHTPQHASVASDTRAS